MTDDVDDLERHLGFQYLVLNSNRVAVLSPVPLVFGGSSCVKSAHPVGIQESGVRP